MTLDWKAIVITLAFALGRNLCGWGHKALEDGKIERWELAQLGKTTLKIAVITAGASFGFNLATSEAAGLAMLADVLKLDKLGAKK